MGLMDRFKNLVNPTDIDENYDDEYVFDGGENTEYDEDDYHQQGQQTQQQIHSSQGQHRQNPGGGSGNVALSGSSLELKVIRPDRWENVNQIADHLINHRTVVLNLEAANKETARRMIDFLLGVVYTIEGDIKKVANNTWVITPSNVDLSQEQQSKQTPRMDSYDSI
ncbi:MAG: cell division protein SepF [Eubacteriales bacterium]|jgi:cell division inhibitor SepF|nr:cell division protein SepF [Eubacteriales bacterium]